MRVMVGERPEQVTPREVPFRQFRIQRQPILHGGKRFFLPLFSLWVDDKSLRPVFAPQGRIGGCELGIASDGLLQQLDGGLIVLAIFQADVHQRAQVKVIASEFVRCERASRACSFGVNWTCIAWTMSPATSLRVPVMDTLPCRTELHSARPRPDLFVSPHATSQIDSFCLSGCFSRPLAVV